MIVDDEDFDELQKYTWSVTVGDCVTTTVNRKTIVLHRLIMKAASTHVVDHINGNRLDNRKENLRLCTWSQNQGNRKMNKNNTSGYRGVIWVAQRNYWVARLKKDGTPKHLGCFKTKEEAAKAYKIAAIKQFGEFLNTTTTLND